MNSLNLLQSHFAGRMNEPALAACRLTQAHKPKIINSLSFFRCDILKKHSICKVKTVYELSNVVRVKTLRDAPTSHGASAAWYLTLTPITKLTTNLQLSTHYFRRRTSTLRHSTPWPFHNNRSSSPEDGMEKSYDEILRLLDFLNIPADGFAYRGSRAFLSDNETPVPSDAATDMIERAMAATPEDPLYVVAVGAITNVASAILMEPEIIKRIVVVWLGGNPLYWPHTREFNLMQDLRSAQVVLNCGVPFVWPTRTWGRFTPTHDSC